jgi:hypothetical protein
MDGAADGAAVDSGYAYTFFLLFPFDLLLFFLLFPFDLLLFPFDLLLFPLPFPLLGCLPFDCTDCSFLRTSREGLCLRFFFLSEISGIDVALATATSSMDIHLRITLKFGMAILGADYPCRFYFYLFSFRMIWEL